MLIRQIEEKDKKWIINYLSKEWRGEIIVSRGKVHKIKELNGFVAVENNDYVGVITYLIVNDGCEIVSINSLKEKQGIGTALLHPVIYNAKKHNYKRIWCITTNDNIDALSWYQKRGFHIKAVYPNAIKHSRKLKPSIPSVGNYSIPIRDEIEMELLF
jgi:N-acetylglutamate synthase-like GNAT family acetyltransferase